MALAPGTRLGPYAITGPIGAGGMGEVYKATDTRLDRTVAIKVLPEHVASDADLKQRFEREAKTLATLNHPHICHIHDVGSQNGIDFLVMEYLEGETVEQRLKKGALPLDQALQIGIQIADALAAAHRAGVIHRDVKPGNVMLTKSGAKLLDFGLAKLRPASLVSMSGMTRVSTMAPGTASGTILGTVHYMAPEQVEGRDADARSDIWALGALLYEMVTGRRAFDGESPASVIGAILKDHPPRLSARQPLAPPALDYLVERCLAKNGDERWQNAGDAKHQLEWIAGTDTTAAPVLLQRRRYGGAIAAVVAAVAIGAVAMVLTTRSSPSNVPSNPVVRAVDRLTHEAGFSEWPTWSPDGRVMAFSSNRSGNFEIYVRRVDGGEDINVTNDPADDLQPAFSPDGASLAFVSTRMAPVPLIRIGGAQGFTFRTYGGDVWVMPAFGGLPRRIAERGNFPIWQPDGRGVTYISGREGHRSVLTATIDGTREGGTLLAEDRSSWEIMRIAYAPGGRWLSVESADLQIRLLPTDGGDPQPLVGGSSHTWDRAARRLYYVAGIRAATTIESVQFDETNGSISAPATVGVTTGILHDLAVGPDGAQLLAAERDESLNLTRLAFDRDGARPIGPEEVLSQGQVRDGYPMYSADGGRIAVVSNRMGTQELWVLELRTKRWQRLLLPAESGSTNTPCWAPDGRSIAVGRVDSDRTESLWLIASDGSSARQLVGGRPLRGNPGAFACKFSPDGQTLLYTSIVGSHEQILELDLGSSRERQITTSASDKYDPAWSPDGRWIAYVSNAGGSVQLWRMPAAGGHEEQLTSGEERMRHVFYSPDGRWIYVQASHRNIFRLASSGGPLQKVTDFPESGLLIEEPTISPDGSYLAYNRSNGGSSLWLLTLGSAGAESR